MKDMGGNRIENTDHHAECIRLHADVTLYHVFLLLLFLTLLSCRMTAKTYAKYTAYAEGSDFARIARFDVEETDNFQKIFTVDNETSREIQVRIRNSSEVSVKYSFSFEIMGNLPLIIEGAGPAGGTALSKEEGKNIWHVEKSPGSFDESYTFTVGLADNEESYIYAGGVSSIQLTVDTVQMD